ncbi:MAG: hypothetical protein PWQ55_1561 [Chloroflexota bacterium]|nr:hypothetical protein [Chloroflexota bacterium]
MNRTHSILILAAVLLVSIACTFPLAASNRQDDVADAVAATVQAAMEKTQAAATYTPLPTLTPYPTYTAVSQRPNYPQPTYAPENCNQATFISETIPDNTVFQPGEDFTKSWRLKNTGTCTWNPNYSFVFYSGDRMSGDKVTDLDEYVKPGETIDVLVDMTAPSDPDTYTGYWRMQDDGGTNFYQVYVTIKVKDSFAVTGVVLDSTPASYSGDCTNPLDFSIDAKITASSAGRVYYQWKNSEGYTGDMQSIKFSDGGTKTVTYDWTIAAPETKTYTVSIYIGDPNHQTFGPVDIDVECIP